MFRFTTTLVAVTLTAVLLGGCPFDPIITVNLTDESGAPGDANSTSTPSSSTSGAGSGSTSGQADPDGSSAPQSQPTNSSNIGEPDSPGEPSASTAPTTPAEDDGESNVPAAAAPSGPQVDTQIAGTWLRESNYWDSNSGYSSTLFYVLRLNADGSFVYATQFGAYNGATLLTEPSAQHGHWRTTGGQMTLTYDSGLVEQLSYYAQVLAGDYLMLWTLPNGAQLMWNWAG